jgi:flavin-dependent dehydrogenase
LPEFIQERSLRIAIAGAGTTGAYCCRLLKNKGFQVHLYDRKRKTACGINPCAWGTSVGFTELASTAGLYPEKYILQRFDSVIMDDVLVKGNLMTFDKPAFLRDLLGDVDIRDGVIPAHQYDRIIDATGVARSYLPPLPNDLLLPATQHRVQTKEPLQNRIKLTRVGYAWCFPLGEMGAHIGCGSLVGDPDKALEEIGWLPKRWGNPHGHVLCACKGRLRLSSPLHSQPFCVEGPPGGIWGIGEAIGCVAPLAGDGIVPGMRSVQLLLDHWEDPANYTRAVLKEFEWMTRERHVVNKLLAASPLGVKDAWVLRKNSRRMAMKVGFKEALGFLKTLRTRSRESEAGCSRRPRGTSSHNTGQE